LKAVKNDYQTYEENFANNRGDGLVDRQCRITAAEAAKGLKPFVKK